MHHPSFSWTRLTQSGRLVSRAAQGEIVRFNALCWSSSTNWMALRLPRISRWVYDRVASGADWERLKGGGGHNKLVSYTRGHSTKPPTTQQALPEPICIQQTRLNNGQAQPWPLQPKLISQQAVSVCVWVCMCVYMCLSVYLCVCACVCVQTSQIYSGFPHSSPHRDREGGGRKREGFAVTLSLSLSCSLSLYLTSQSCRGTCQIIHINADRMT